MIKFKFQIFKLLFFLKTGSIKILSSKMTFEKSSTHQLLNEKLIEFKLK